MNILKQYGASDRFFAEATLYPHLSMARVLSQYKDSYKVVTEHGEGLAEVSGKFRYDAACPAEYPAVGDYVMLDWQEGGNAIIHHVLTRKSAFERSAAGANNQAQVVAANIDLVFICMSLNNDYNPRRLERYLAVAWDSRATPVVVLTKSDLCDDLAAVLRELNQIVGVAEIIVTSKQDEKSCEKLLAYLQPGVTASFIGSSGVGKSTLINRLFGEERLATSAIRGDDKGRHTTTHRELLLLPNGGIVIDTPGMRELAIESADFSKSFSDIDELGARCRFKDCTHTDEPGCAVKQAIEDGELDEKRLGNYNKLKKESGYEGLSSKQIEAQKIKNMFGSMGEMKKTMDYVKNKKRR